MPARLPKVVAAYFAATNRHDVPAMMATFSQRAVVRDEGREHRGLEAIRQWAEETIGKYDFSIEAEEATETDGGTMVTGQVSGTFPGSPLRIRFSFSFDHEKISRLEIG